MANGARKLTPRAKQTSGIFTDRLASGWLISWVTSVCPWAILKFCRRNSGGKQYTGHVDEVEIGVPDWVYNGFVKEEGHPHILTINPDYFLIGQSIGRVIYRLARKAAGKHKAE